MTRNGYPLLQVYSITVQRKDQKPIHVNGSVRPDGTLELNTDVVGDLTPEKSVKLYGTIKLVDALGVTDALLFNSSREMPEIIDTNDTIPLSFLPRLRSCISTYDLDMRIDLKDADGDLEICRGYLIYDFRDPECYYSRRLTSVIPGNHGAAIVNYTLFSEAVQAYVKVQLVIGDGFNLDDSYIVSGSLFGRYKGHDYRSEYQKKYFQIVIFRRKKEDGAVLFVDKNSNSIALPLSCPLLAVPFETSFIIKSDLVVKSGETEIATVRGTAEFPQVIDDQAPTPTPPMIIAGNNAHLNITVFWASYSTYLIT